MPRTRVRTKVALTLLVPLGSLLILTVIEVRSTAQRRDEVLDQTDLARAAIGPSGLITAVQDELNWASVELTGFQEQVALRVSSYEETRQRTDDAIVAFRSTVEGAAGPVQDAFGPALNGLGALADLRRDVDADPEPHDVTNFAFSQEVIDRYNALILPLLDAAQQVGAEVGDEELRVGLILSDAVTRQITTVQLAIGEMVKAVLLSSGGIDDRDEILDLIYLRTTLVEQGQVMASADGVYADLPGAAESADLTHRIDDQLLWAIGANELDLNDLVDAIGNPDDQPYFAYQEEVQRIVAVRADELESAALARQRMMLALAGLTLAVATVVVLAISRSITRPLVSLTEQARDLATDRLPGAVHELLETPAGADLVPPEVVPVTVDSSAEVSEVAEALNKLQDSAVNLAVGQAMLRRNISDSLISLGRRNQNLLARQIDFITQLEADETDPRVLDHLFRLDHLATRMRRNAEGLMVLAELDSPRHWATPVPVMDVIRSALGEVEDYRRVVVGAVHPAEVQGNAAVDLAHLLAELVENALVYSPPDHRVEISGQAGVPGAVPGYTLAVVDWGIGMSPAEMATANRRLNGHESFTVAPSSYLGHYVAGKLAVRHSVSIYLRPTNGGGTTALVQIPLALLTSPDAAPAPTPLGPAAPVAPVASTGTPRAFGTYG